MSKDSYNDGDGGLSGEEVARRRDQVIRRMANTPPQPKVKKTVGATTKGDASDQKRKRGLTRREA
jgi:hypothetical protein